MDTPGIRKKLHDIIDNADDEKVEEMFIRLTDNADQPYKWWNDEKFVAELEQISADMKSGKDKGFTLEESMAHLRAHLKRNG